MTTIEVDESDLSIADGAIGDLLQVTEDDITDGTVVNTGDRRKRRQSAESDLNLLVAQFRTTYLMNTDGYDPNADSAKNDVETRIAAQIRSLQEDNVYAPNEINLVAKPRQSDLYTRYDNLLDELFRIIWKN